MLVADELMQSINEPIVAGHPITTTCSSIIPVAKGIGFDGPDFVLLCSTNGVLASRPSMMGLPKQRQGTFSQFSQSVSQHYT